MRGVRRPSRRRFSRSGRLLSRRDLDDRRCRLCRSRRFLGGRLLRRFFRLGVALQALPLGLAPDAVSLGVLDARRVALDPDPERATQIERLLVGEPELSRQLIDPDPSCQLLVQPFLLAYS
jgi:hypothetical protein